jgi:hypothetical protein
LTFNTLRPREAESGLPCTAGFVAKSTGRYADGVVETESECPGNVKYLAIANHFVLPIAAAPTQDNTGSGFLRNFNGFLCTSQNSCHK